jgi:hypothetical protein
MSAHADVGKLRLSEIQKHVFPMKGSDLRNP